MEDLLRESSMDRQLPLRLLFAHMEFTCRSKHFEAISLMASFDFTPFLRLSSLSCSLLIEYHPQVTSLTATGHASTTYDLQTFHPKIHLFTFCTSLSNMTSNALLNNSERAFQNIHDQMMKIEKKGT